MMNTLKNAKRQRPLIKGIHPQHLPDERFEVSSGGKTGNYPNVSACFRFFSALLLCLLLPRSLSVFFPPYFLYDSYCIN